MNFDFEHLTFDRRFHASIIDHEKQELSKERNIENLETGVQLPTVRYRPCLGSTAHITFRGLNA